MSSSSDTATIRNDVPHSQAEEHHSFLTQNVNGSIFPLATQPHLEQYGVGSGRRKRERRTLGLHFGKTLIILTVLLWACLSIFWGSTYQLLKYFPKLTVNIYDFDTLSSPTTSILGPTFLTYAQTQQSLPISISTPHVGYRIIDVASSGLTEDDARDDVLKQKCWAAIVIHGNATSGWRRGVEGGVEHEAQGSMGIYYEGARYYQVLLLYLRPFLEKDASTVISTASQIALSTILTSLSPDYTPPTSLASSSSPPINPLTATSGTLTGNIQAQPGLMATPFGYYVYDLRPQTSWGTAAVFEAGDIYYLIFAFHLALWHYLGRTGSGLQDRLKYRSLVGLRLLVPLVCYFFMALWYTCIIAAFKTPFNNTVGRAGFVTDWALNYVTLVALGLAFETMMSILGPKLLPLFLILWIILNITSSFLPIGLMDPFYKWFIIFPFFHHVAASKIIFFNVAPASRLGKHFGALFGAIGVHLICLPTAIWFERWKEEKDAKKEEKKEREEKEKRADGGEAGDNRD